MQNTRYLPRCQMDHIHAKRKFLQLHHNTPGYKYNTLHIDFDALSMILTFTSITNVYILKYPHHPQQAWRPVVMWDYWMGKTKYSDLH